MGLTHDYKTEDGFETIERCSDGKIFSFDKKNLDMSGYDYILTDDDGSTKIINRINVRELNVDCIKTASGHRRK